MRHAPHPRGSCPARGGMPGHRRGQAPASPASSRSPCAQRPRHLELALERSPRATHRRARCRSRGDRGLGRPPRERHGRDGRMLWGPVVSLHQWPLSWEAGGRVDPQPPARSRRGRRGVRDGVPRAGRAGGCGIGKPDLVLVPSGIRRPRRRRKRFTGARARRRSWPGVGRARSRGATTSPRLVDAALSGFD